MKTMLTKVTSKSFRIITVLGLLGLLSVAVPGVTTTAVAQQDGKVPGQSLGLNSDADLWRLIRNGNSGDTQIKSELAEVMIQSEGDNWRAVRNGPISIYGAGGVIGMVILLAVFYTWRGRIMIDAGPSSEKVERFAALDRFSHWLMAGSFVILAITGLNLLYGRYVLLPIIGPRGLHPADNGREIRA